LIRIKRESRDTPHHCAFIGGYMRPFHQGDIGWVFSFRVQAAPPAGANRGFRRARGNFSRRETPFPSPTKSPDAAVD
jgi:hypothetical protein